MEKKLDMTGVVIVSICIVRLVMTDFQKYMIIITNLFVNALPVGVLRFKS